MASICDLDAHATRPIKGLGARSDTAQEVAIFDFIDHEDCDPALVCADNLLKITCGSSVEQWTLGEPTDLGYSATLKITEDGAPYTTEVLDLGI
jgi:hypothetical protein